MHSGLTWFENQGVHHNKTCFRREQYTKCDQTSVRQNVSATKKFVVTFGLVFDEAPLCCFLSSVDDVEKISVPSVAWSNPTRLQWESHVRKDTFTTNPPSRHMHHSSPTKQVAIMRQAEAMSDASSTFPSLVFSFWVSFLIELRGR